MINKNRIVPVTKTDLLTLYGTMLNSSLDSLGVLKASDIEGNFDASEKTSGAFICDQPVKSLELPYGVVFDVSIWFTAAYDFEGITIHGGENVDDSGSPVAVNEIVKDCATLYKVVRAIDDTANEALITAVSPVES